jgi:lipopolysaccharide export system permease protein
MRISLTLSTYIGRHFLVSFFTCFGIFLLVVMLFDSIELLRRTSALPNVDFTDVLEFAFLRLPHLGQKLFPFAILFGGMAAFWRLARTHELVITRAAGVSAWQFLLPVLALAGLLGLLHIMVLNPLASTLLTRYERLEATLLKGQSNFLAVSDAGFWLRQANSLGQSVVHAGSVYQQGTDVELNDVVVFVYEGADNFRERIDADYAKLEDGFWYMLNARIQKPEEAPLAFKEYWLETDLTLAKIQDSFAPPETMSFWALSDFIKTLEDAGFSALRHKLHLNTLLASPLLMCAMVLIAATFTLRQNSRRGGTTFIISAGVMTGFLLYFFSDVVYALGLSDSIPVTLAAWTPSGVATLLGLGMLLHLEDG